MDAPTESNQQAQRKWVWYCNDASIADRKISVLAVLEVLLAMGAYWWISTSTGWHWMLFLSLFAAPVLLLRSHQSVALGLRWFEYYLGKEDINLIDVFATFLISLTLGGVLAYFVSQKFLFGMIGSSLFLKSALLGILVVMVVGITAVAHVAVAAVVGANKIIAAATAVGVPADMIMAAAKAAAVPSDKLIAVVAAAIVAMIAVAGAAAGTVAIASAFSGAVAGAGVLAGVVAVAVVGLYKSKVIYFTLLIPFNLLLVFASFIRITFIRIISCIFHPIAGLAQIQFNWRINLLATDFTHMPEVLPRVGEKFPNLTIRGLLDRTKTESNWLEKILSYTFLPIIYLPALAYRWSLKSTCWFWWPLVLALQPPLYQLDSKLTRERIDMVGAWIQYLLLGGIAAMLWAWLPLLPDLQEIHDELPKLLQILLSKLPELPLYSLRFCLLNLAFLLLLMMAMRNHNLKAIEGLKDDPERYTEWAKRVDAFRAPLMACLIFFGQAWIIKLAWQHQASFIEGLFPTWFLQLL